ncbi:MAG: helix-turn-helix domain-containing protein [Candidatus Omnitrophica bacterium]|nr:helix-turn-helix domain-containing protein [Candidatus Omnitrophota bacterium]MBU1043387.1 helix-turn-helix domain-containing protein [Candidatus Omnitrophota bacterium]
MTIDIAGKLKTKRLQMHLTQLELAKKIGVSESYICQIEKGKMVSIKKLEQLAGALGCKAKDLL